MFYSNQNYTVIKNTDIVFLFQTIIMNKDSQPLNITLFRNFKIFFVIVQILQLKYEIIYHNIQNYYDTMIIKLLFD